MSGLDFTRDRAVDAADRGALDDVLAEIRSARSRYPAMASLHEGLAVTWEEFDEWKAEIFKNPKRRDDTLVREEGIQLAAMVIRTLVDCIDCPRMEAEWREAN